MQSNAFEIEVRAESVLIGRCDICGHVDHPATVTYFMRRQSNPIFSRNIGKIGNAAAQIVLF